MNKYYIILIIMLPLLWGCEENKGIPSRANDSLGLIGYPDQISWNDVVYFVDSSYTKAILRSTRSRIYQQRQETMLDSGVKVDFFSKTSGNRLSWLSSDSAKIDEKTKNMTAYGQVIVFSDSSNTKLETNLIVWDNSKQKIYSTEYVKITSPNETLTGYGFESDVNLSNYKIYKVSGVQR